MHSLPSFSNGFPFDLGSSTRLMCTALQHFSNLTIKQVDRSLRDEYHHIGDLATNDKV